MECPDLQFIGQPLRRALQFFEIHGTPSFFAFYYIKGLHDLGIGAGTGYMKNMKYSFFFFFLLFCYGIHLDT